jgi:hypothetical protein
MAAAVATAASAAGNVWAGIMKPFRAVARHVSSHASFYLGMAVGAAVTALLLACAALVLSPGAIGMSGVPLDAMLHCNTCFH